MKLSWKILYIYSGVSVYRLVRLFVRCVRRQDATFVPVVSARPSPDTVWLPLPSSSVSNDNPIVADWLCACVAHGADTDKAQRARTIKRCWWLQPRGLCAPAQCRLGPRNRARACWVDVGVLVSHHASRRIPRCSSTASLMVWCRQTDSPGVRCRCGEATMPCSSASGRTLRNRTNRWCVAPHSPSIRCPQPVDWTLARRVHGECGAREEKPCHRIVQYGLARHERRLAPTAALLRASSSSFTSCRACLRACEGWCRRRGASRFASTSTQPQWSSE